MYRKLSKFVMKIHRPWYTYCWQLHLQLIAIEFKSANPLFVTIVYHCLFHHQSLKSRGYVKEQFAWRHYYWYLTNEGIQYLRDFLHLPPEIVPATLRRQARPETAKPRPKGKLLKIERILQLLKKVAKLLKNPALYNQIIRPTLNTSSDRAAILGKNREIS